MRTSRRSIAMWLALSACSGPEPPPGYRQVEVPEERLASPEARRRGRELFLEHCALCHGERADGRGRRRANLSSPPADFTGPRWREQTTPRQVYAVIREGKPGTSMASWRALGEDETWDVVTYLLSVSEEGP